MTEYIDRTQEPDDVFEREVLARVDDPMTPVPSSPVALLDQLDELRARGTADGPWRLVDNGPRNPLTRYEVMDDEGTVAVCNDDNEDTNTSGAQRAALIVAAVNAVGPLAAAVRDALAVCAEIEQEQAKHTEAETLTFHGLGQLSAISKIRAALSVTP